MGEAAGTSSSQYGRSRLVLISAGACLLVFEYLLVYVVFQRAGHYNMVYGQVLFWLYTVLPLLALATSVCIAWLAIKTHQSRWLVVLAPVWLPSGLLLLGSAMVSH